MVKCIALWLYASVFHLFKAYTAENSQPCSMSAAVIIHPEHSPGVWFRGNLSLTHTHTHTHTLTDVTDGLVNILLVFCSAVKHLMAACSHLTRTRSVFYFYCSGRSVLQVHLLHDAPRPSDASAGI